MQIIQRLPIALMTFAVALPATTFADDTMTIRRFKGSHETTTDLRPIAEYRWRVTPFETKTCTDVSFVAVRSQRKLSIAVTAERFDPTRHQFDFDANTIDGRPALGHDGLVSAEHLAVNFSHRNYIKSVSASFGDASASIPKRQFTYMLGPHLAGRDGCSIHAFWAATPQLIVLRITGGDSAGAYATYLLFGATGFRGQFVSTSPFLHHFLSDYFHPAETVTIELAPLYP